MSKRPMQFDPIRRIRCVARIATLVAGLAFNVVAGARTEAQPSRLIEISSEEAPSHEVSVAGGSCVDGVGPCCQPCSYFTSFESSEGFTAGAWIGDGNQGAVNGPLYTWDARCSLDSGNSTEGHVATAHPLAGSQHLRFSKDPAAPTGFFSCTLDARVPSTVVANNNTPPQGPVTISIHLAGATGGPSFVMQPRATNAGIRVADMLFYYYGTLYVLDRVPGMQNYVDIGDWDSSGDYRKYTMHIDPCTPFKCLTGDNDTMACTSDSDCAGTECRGRIDYYLDDQLIHQGMIWNPFGTAVPDQLLLFTDNQGDVSHPGFDVDDVEIIRGEPCLGACCDAFGTCTNHEFQEPCDGISFYPHPCGSAEAVCPPASMGACCDRLTAACTETTESACIGNSTFSLGTHCGPGVCQPDKGACCVQSPFDATCSITKDADCSGFFTAGAVCGAVACAPAVIPTVSEWGLLILALCLLAVSKVVFAVRRDHGMSQA